MPKSRIIVVAVGLLITAVAYATGAMEIDHEVLTKLFGETMSNQITQLGICFTIAAWLHSGRVKKEIRANFSALTTAINNVAESLKEDLKAHSDKIDNLTTRVQKLEDRKPMEG